MPTLPTPACLHLTRDTAVACLSMIVLALLTAPPGYAQFGGDAFSAGSAFGDGPAGWWNYYLEWDPEPVKSPLARSKQEVLTQPAASGNQPDLFAALAESSPAPRGDQFAPGETDPVGLATQVTGSQTESVDIVVRHRLQGATNNTSVGMSGTPAKLQRPSRIVFRLANPSTGQVRRVLEELGAPKTTVLHSIPRLPLVPARASQVDILQKIAELETQAVMRIHRYKVLTVTRIKMNGARVKSIWTNVYGEESPVSAISQLYVRAADLERSVARRHIYLANAASYRQDWDEVWRHCEDVYKLAKDNAGMIHEVVSLYRRFGGRDLEQCIWLTRYLRVAPDWVAFDLAYNERAAIETFWEDERIRNEKGPNISWKSRRAPLRVYFTDGDKPDFDKRLKDCFRECMAEWIQAMQGKLDYVETRNRGQSDVVCEWQEPEQRYEVYDGSSKAPRGRPRMERVGNTQVVWTVDGHGKRHLVRAVVGIFACQGGGMRIVDDDELRAKLMHEVGHGLGIVKHLRLESDCMYPTIDDLALNLDLSPTDKQTMFALYKGHPTNQAAVDKFIGMRAVCKRLGRNPESSLPNEAEIQRRDSKSAS